MTASNINIDDFLHVLSTLRSRGYRMVDLDFQPDEHTPGANKIVIHPVNYDNGYPQEHQYQSSNPYTRTEIRDPNISPDGDEIFDAFDL